MKTKKLNTLERMEAAVAEAQVMFARLMDLQREGVRIRLRRHHSPELVKEFCCWVAVFKDGHEEFLMPLTTKPKGLPKRADVVKRHWSDDVKAVRIARFMEKEKR